MPRAVDVAAVVAFHGHFCPGLATGIRLCEAVLERLGGRAQDEELVAIIETANCAADAIQFILGCTYGKGNLIHLDRCRNVYTFLRRSDSDRGNGLARRLTCLPQPDDMTEEQKALVSRVRAGSASAQDRAAYTTLWEGRGYAILERPLETLFRIETLDNYPAPPHARMEPSVACDACGALVMASRLTDVDGRRLCAACAPARPAEGLAVTAIGVVRNELSPDSPPRVRSARSRLEINPAYADALLGLAPGQQIDVLFYFDRSSDTVPLQQRRHGDPANPPSGVFALRSPRRLSPIGVTRVEILAAEPYALVVAGLDAWDGSPVIDIKPA
jgi:formylmethanofuran dehydrogenase subunit E